MSDRDITIAYMALGFAAAWNEADKEGRDLPPQIEAMLEVIAFADFANETECGDVHAYDLAEPFGAELTRQYLVGKPLTISLAGAVLEQVHNHGCLSE